MACEGFIEFLLFVFSLFAKLFLDFVLFFLSPIFYIIYSFQQSTRECDPFSRKRFHSILVTGAFSGIGKEFAIQMAASDKTLFLTGRNRDKLDAVKAECEQKGAEVVTFVVDVKNAQQMSNCVLQADNQRPLDLIFANAGLGFTTCQSHDFVGRFYELVDTNILGTINTIFPLLPRLLSRKSGHIAINASLSSYVNKPQISPYAMTKVFLRFFGEILRFGLKPFNISVTLVNAGYVQTPLLEAHKHQSSSKELNAKYAKLYSRAMPVSRAVSKHIIPGLERNRYSIDFPCFTFILAWWLGSTHPIIRSVIGNFVVSADECSSEFNETSVSRSLQKRLQTHGTVHNANGSHGSQGSHPFGPHLGSMDDKFKFSITQPGAVTSLGGKVATQRSGIAGDEDYAVELGQNMGLEQEKEKFLQENRENRAKQRIVAAKDQDNVKAGSEVKIANGRNGSDGANGAIGAQGAQKGAQDVKINVGMISEMSVNVENEVIVDAPVGPRDGGADEDIAGNANGTAEAHEAGSENQKLL